MRNQKEAITSALFKGQEKEAELIKGRWGWVFGNFREDGDAGEERWGPGKDFPTP